MNQRTAASFSREDGDVVEADRLLAWLDEVESHLHLSLQEQLLSLLSELHPQYQFVVATHSAPVLASLSNALVVDLATRATCTSGELRGIPYGDLMKGHFGLESDIDLLRRFGPSTY